MVGYEPLGITRPVEHVALLEMGRLDELNLWSLDLEAELFGALDELGRDPDIRAIGILSRGKAFCGGVDLGSFKDRLDASKSAPDAAAPPRASISAADIARRRVLRALSIPKPVIAAVNGHCVGMGLGIALSCDFRLAAADVRFQSGFPKRGLVAEHGTAWMLPRLVGVGRALDILMTSRTVAAEEALAIGLVHRIVEPDSRREALVEFAEHLATQVSPRSLAVIKAQVYRDLDLSLDEAMSLTAQDMADAFGVDDAREGIASFLERRTPRFPPHDGVTARTRPA